MLLDDENRLDLDDIATAAETAIEAFSFRDAAEYSSELARRPQ